MREVGLSLARGLAPVGFKSGVDERLKDPAVLSEMAHRGGAPEGTGGTMAG